MTPPPRNELTRAEVNAVETLLARAANELAQQFVSLRGSGRLSDRAAERFQGHCEETLLDTLTEALHEVRLEGADEWAENERLEAAVARYER